MPRIRYTVTEYTATVDLTLHYQCSSCGAENHCDQVVSSNVKDTALDGGLFATGSPKAARDGMHLITKQLSAPNPVDRYDLAGFNCRCWKCGKREPWAKMRSKIVSKVQQILFSAMVALAMVAIVFLIVSVIINELHEGLKTFPKILGLSAVPAIPYLVCVLYKFCKRRLMRKQIAMLPPKSIPLITPKIKNPQNHAPSQSPASSNVAKSSVSDHHAKTANSIPLDEQKKRLREQLFFARKCQTPESLRKYLYTQMPRATELEKETFEKLLALSDEHIMDAVKQEMEN